MIENVDCSKNIYFGTGEQCSPLRIVIPLYSCKQSFMQNQNENKREFIFRFPFSPRQNFCLQFSAVFQAHSKHFEPLFVSLPSERFSCAQSALFRVWIFYFSEKRIFPYLSLFYLFNRVWKSFFEWSEPRVRAIFHS